MSRRKYYFQTAWVIFSEIFIDLWYDYIIDKPYAVVNQNNPTFKSPKMCSTSLIISISSVRYIRYKIYRLGVFEP